MTRLVLVDDHPLVRRGLREALAGHPGMAVVAEVERAEDVLPALHAHPCDVLLLDLALPDGSGFNVLGDVQRDFPRVATLVVSSHATSTHILRAMRGGAAGFVPKAAPETELLQAIESVVRTGHYISDEVAIVLAEFAKGTPAAAPATYLSDREMDVLLRLAGGETVSAIADSLSLSIKTVSTYRTRVLAKLGLHTTAELVRYALEQRLID